jgi:hypothetical protein
MKTLVLHYTSMMNIDLSYQHGWVKGFKFNKNFNCTFVNLADFYHGKKDILNFSKLKNLRALKELILKKYEVIIILHSVFSNACLLSGSIQNVISLKKSYKIHFMANEYKLMPEKINFVKKLKINLLVTQSHNENVINLYRNKLKIEVIHIPGGGLDEEIFYPMNLDRDILIGYRTHQEPEYLGHQKRVVLYNFLKEYSKKNNDIYDVSLRVEDRFNFKDWAIFLNRCSSMPSTITGSDFFYLDDKIRNQVNKYYHNYLTPNSLRINKFDSTYKKNFNIVYEKFFKNLTTGTKWRGLTGKVIEAMGTKTINILVDGDYGPLLKPDEHYIPLKKNFSNFEECIEKVKDKNYFYKITENSYKLSREKLTFTKYIDDLYKNILKLI